MKLFVRGSLLSLRLEATNQGLNIIKKIADNLLLSFGNVTESSVQT
jgi:hypothetical protein